MIKLQRSMGFILFSAWLSVQTTAIAQVSEELQLPELGDSTSSLFSLEQEYQMGRAWLRAFRSQVKTVDDPLLQDYLEFLTYRLATHSELKDRRLDIVVVDNRTLNAFAVPGGVIGVHNGLLLYADTEAQLASVLTHELAHLSQRHFARTQDAKNNPLSMAGMLAGFVLAATVGGDAGVAAIAASQAAALQNFLRYSRLHEQEADRKGMQTMVRAEMDPNAVTAMFENMLNATRYAGKKPPEFLLTHPITENRISDSSNRARQYPRQVYTDNLDYQLMRARTELHFAGNSKAAIKSFTAKLNSTDRFPEAHQYGLVLALTQNGDTGQARHYLKPLLDNSPNKISYIVASADIDITAGKHQQAIKQLSQSLSLSPGNHPLVMTLADAYIKAAQPHKAEALLKEHVKRRSTDPYVWYLLAETQGLAGNIIGVHQSRAEFFILNGVLDKAQKQLHYALPLLKNDHLTQTKVKERIKQIQLMKEALKKL